MEKEFIKDYLDIISDIELRDSEKGNILSWIYRHTLYKHYKKKLNESIDTLGLGFILSKDNVQEIIYYISNTFASEGGYFYPMIDARSITFREGEPDQYTMYSAKLRVGSSYAELKTYSNSTTVEVIYHDKIVDIKSRSSSFTFNGETLNVTDKGQKYTYRQEKILEVNDELMYTIQKYLKYCLNGKEGEE